MRRVIEERDSFKGAAASFASSLIAGSLYEHYGFRHGGKLDLLMGVWKCLHYGSMLHLVYESSVKDPTILTDANYGQPIRFPVAGEPRFRPLAVEAWRNEFLTLPVEFGGLDQYHID